MERNPCGEVPDPGLSPMRRCPVVKTVEEAKEVLRRGSGVGIDFTGKSAEEIEAAQAELSEFILRGKRNVTNSNES